MITVVNLDGSSYAVQNERVAATLLAALPYLIPVETSYNANNKKAPVVRPEPIDLDIFITPALDYSKRPKHAAATQKLDDIATAAFQILGEDIKAGDNVVDGVTRIMQSLKHYRDTFDPG